MRFSQLLIRDLGIQILAFNETKLDPEFPKELTFVAGYQQERLDRTCNGGGISIYIRDSIKYKRRLDIPTDNLELIFIEVEPPKSKSFLVLAWYCPPSDPAASFTKLEKDLSFWDKEGREIILLGDTNCDLTPKQAEQPIDNNSKHMLDLYELFSFKQLIEEPTRVTLTTSSINDHIATTSARNIVKSGVYEVSMSDHYMVYCIRKFNGAVEKDNKMIKTQKTKTRRPRHSKYLRSRTQLYGCSKCCATFNLINQATLKLIVLFGDIEMNPGPLKNPCSMCKKAVARTHRSLKCSTCNDLCHIGKNCGNVKNQDFINIKGQGSGYLWSCPVCLGLQQQQQQLQHGIMQNQVAPERINDHSHYDTLKSQLE